MGCLLLSVINTWLGVGVINTSWHLALSTFFDCRDLIPVSQIAVIAVIITAIGATWVLLSACCPRVV